MSGLGRRVPTDWRHVERWPASAVLADTPVVEVERTLRLPAWHWSWDQGREGSCVGQGCSMMMSVLNGGRRYDPLWLWNEAKRVDDWPDTNPGDDSGTSVRAACDVLRSEGHVRVVARRDLAPSVAEGVKANRWAKTVDEMRASIAMGVPVSIGVDWLTNFDSPVRRGREWWIGSDGWERTELRGGHCVCLYAASDRRQGFKFKNSWGRAFPLCWLPYETVGRLLERDGEAALVTDR